MDSNLEKECTAMGGLFQQIISDLKNGTPIWEDLISKASKLHTCLRATIHAIAAYLDAFQKIADAATNTKGATKDIGTTLTRICLRQKAVEARIKTFTSAIMDCLVVPLQEKIEEWKKSVVNLDKDHAKEYKKARAELKKRSTDTLRLQKKVGRKGVVGRNGDLQKALQEVNDKKVILEEAEKKALRAAMIEERSRYCVFVTYLKPVVDEEVAMLAELSRLQEVVEQLDKHTTDPYTLPAASEQVIADMKGSDASWMLNSPPSSPGSLGSRKSSMCSISSINSSSSGSTQSHHSPSHHYWNRGVGQRPPLPGSFRLSSVSSQDSGFTSQSEFGYFNSRLSIRKAGTKQDETDTIIPCAPSFTESSSVASCNTVTSTWPNLQDTLQFERAASAIISERPHTISSAYERGGQHTRPALSVYTFQNPNNNVSQPTSPTSNSSQIYARPPVPSRCSSLERPTVPIKTNNNNNNKYSYLHHPSTQHLTSEYFQPTYVNMHDLANMAASKAHELKSSLTNSSNDGSNTTHSSEHKTESNEKDSSTSESSLESSSGYGSQTQALDMDNSIYNEVNASLMSLNEFVESMTINHHEPRVYQRPASTIGYPNANNMRSTLLRRSSVNTPKPPPPIRRTSSISAGSRSSMHSREGSMENLPPPPAFLLSENSGSNSSLTEIQKSVANSIAAEIHKRNQEINKGHYHRSNLTVTNEGSPKPQRHSIDPTTQPIYGRTPTDQSIYNRSFSDPNGQPIYRSTSTFTGQSVTSHDNKDEVKLSSGLSVAETVRTLTELNHQPASPVSVRRNSRSTSADRQTSIIAQLSARLTPTLSRRHFDTMPRSNRVKQWIAIRASPDPKMCHDSLMEQIKRGKELKKTRTVNDRSAPLIR